MIRTIAVTGGKGGVGKTNTALNLALCLAEKDSRVCLFDADLGLSNINVLLGIYPEFGIEDVVSKEKRLEDVIIKNYHGIDIIPGSSGVEKLANLEKESIDELIKTFNPLDCYDFLIFDTAAGISRNVISFCMASKEIVCVVTPEPTSLTDSYSLLKVLNAQKFTGTIKLVINQCSNMDKATQVYKKLKEVVNKYLAVDIEPLGVILYDEALQEAVKKQVPLITLYPGSKASKGFKSAAVRLLENRTENLNLSSSASFWSRFFSFTGSNFEFNEKHLQVNKNQTDDKITSKKQGILPSKISGQQLKEEKRGLLYTLNFPSLPHILLRLIQACSGEETSLKEIAGIIEKDPVLCSKTLKMVNSAFYHLNTKPTDIEQAVSLLGCSTIRNLAVSASVCQVFSTSQYSSSINLKHFWRHSLYVGICSSLMAKKGSVSSPEDAFLSGLLHDMGKLILLANFPEKYPAILKKAADPEELLNLEKNKLGINHCMAGAELIQKWNLQSFISHAVLYHHEPLERALNAFDFVKIINTSNALCSDNEKLRNTGYRKAWELLGFSSEEVEKILDEMKEKANQTALSLGIEITEEEDVSDKQKQEELSGYVKEISVLFGTVENISKAVNTAEIINAAESGFKILFGAEQLLVFLYKKNMDVLVCSTSSDLRLNSTIGPITVPLRHDRTILSHCFKHNTITDSFEFLQKSRLSIIDEQIIQLTGKEGIICFPLSCRGDCLGVFAVGGDRHYIEFLKHDSALLKNFMNHTCVALYADKLRNQQEVVRITERMDAAKAVARKIAHEVNNPLSIIKNYLKILQMRLAEQNVDLNEIKIIQEEINSASRIVDGLSNFSLPDHAVKELLDINKVISEVLNITKGYLSTKAIRVHTQFKQPEINLKANKEGLKQVFTNLIKNAGEALTEGGDITVKTDLLPSEPPFVQIIISDNGPGLPEEVRQRIFEPYITTKGQGHTGLGLSVVYGIVHSMKGTIQCLPQKDRGTEFKIRLPVNGD